MSDKSSPEIATLSDWTTKASESELSFYQNRRSPRLRNPSSIRLNPREEINWYIENFPPDYRVVIDQLDKQIGEGMNPSCRLCFVVPVADHKEENNIYRTLTCYLKQKDKSGASIDPSQFEVLLLLNHPEGEIPDKTKEEVNRFKTANPQVNIRVAETVFPKKTPIGRVVKTLCDLAVVRSQKRNSTDSSELIVARNDADMADLSETYISNTLSLFDNPDNLHIDAVRGRVKRSDEWESVRKKYPVSYTAYMYRELVRRFNVIHNIYTEMQGANLIVRSGTYAAIGGFNDNSGVGEDTEIAKMIKLARFGELIDIPKEKSPIGYSAAAWIKTDPRRIEYCAAHNILIGNRLKTYRDVISIGPDGKTSTFPDLNIFHLELEINTLNESFGIEPNSLAVTTVLRLLGINYVIQDGKIQITSWKYTPSSPESSSSPLTPNNP